MLAGQRNYPGQIFVEITMPTFNIFVTTPKSEIPDGFVLEASKFLAKQLGKPESVSENLFYHTFPRRENRPIRAERSVCSIQIS